jgi:hypothetical protein
MSDKGEFKIELTDDQINLIVDKVADRIEDRLYHNVGKGVMQLAMKGIIIGIIIVAAYGAGMKNWFSF